MFHNRRRVVIINNSVAWRRPVYPQHLHPFRQQLWILHTMSAGVRPRKLRRPGRTRCRHKPRDQQALRVGLKTFFEINFKIIEYVLSEKYAGLLLAETLSSTSLVFSINAGGQISSTEMSVTFSCSSQRENVSSASSNSWICAAAEAATLSASLEVTLATLKFCREATGVRRLPFVKAAGKNALSCCSSIMTMGFCSGTCTGFCTILRVTCCQFENPKTLFCH